MEGDEGRKKEIITSTEDSICTTKDMLTNIIQLAFEDQKKLADAGSKEAIKSAIYGWNEERL